MTNAYLAGVSRGRIHEDVKRRSLSPRWRRAELNKRKGRRGSRMLDVSRIHIRHLGSPCNMRSAYPTYLANARDTRRHVRAWMRIWRDVVYLFVSWLAVSVRAIPASCHSLLECGVLWSLANQIRLRVRVISASLRPFFDDTDRPRWTISLSGAPSFTARLTRWFFPSRGLLRSRLYLSWTSLSIHSANSTRVVCVAKNRAPRRGVIRHAARSPQGTSVSLLNYSSVVRNTVLEDKIDLESGWKGESGIALFSLPRVFLSLEQAWRRHEFPVLHAMQLRYETEYIAIEKTAS